MKSHQLCRIPVQSSLLSSIGYADQTLLELQFRNGSVYRYFGVPASLYQALISAESKGVFFNRNLRNRFPYQRIA